MDLFTADSFLVLKFVPASVTLRFYEHMRVYELKPKAPLLRERMKALIE